MQTIRQILKKKGRKTWTISPATRVFDALQVMADKEGDPAWQEFKGNAGQ
jgi:prophage tail gpP-like protein